MNRAFELVGPGGISEQTFDARGDFPTRRSGGGAGQLPQALLDFPRANAEVLRDIEQDLRPLVGRGLAPAFRLERGLDGITDILARAHADAAGSPSIEGRDQARVAAVRPGLLAADALFGGAVDWIGHASLPRDESRRGQAHRTLIEPFALCFEIFVQPEQATFAAKAGLLVAAERAGCIELVGAVDPHHAGLDGAGEF